MPEFFDQRFSLGSLTEIIEGYAAGYFPMADAKGKLGWYSSKTHTLIPLDGAFHVPRSLKKALNTGHFRVKINTAFEEVVAGCAARDETWISLELREIYTALHQVGVAHSFETWHQSEQGEQLAGGILGLALGGVFIGESMFFNISEGSKVAMVRLVEHLRAQGFVLFDAQLMNPHLERFGAYDLSSKKYLAQLERGRGLEVRF